MAEKFFCNCSQRCKKPGKWISRSAYNRHAKYRYQDSLGPDFLQLLAGPKKKKARGGDQRAGTSGAVHRSRKGKERAIDPEPENDAGADPLPDDNVDMDVDDNMVSLPSCNFQPAEHLRCSI
jgi:hypothetical protein